MNEKIDKYLKQLNLHEMAKEWTSIPFTTKEEFVLKLLEPEIKKQEAAKEARLVKSAGFIEIKKLDDFEWHSEIDIRRDTTTPEEIKNLGFIPKKENLIFIGAAGTGKTHLASALGLEACQQGKNVRFFKTSKLVNTLLEQKQAGTLDRFLTGLKKLDLMIIDEFGFIPFNETAAMLLFELIEDFYTNKRSLIITSNLEFKQWHTILGNNYITAPLVDRLAHYSHILVFSGVSFRLKQSMERKNR